MTKIEKNPYENFQNSVKKVKAVMYAQKHLNSFLVVGKSPEELSFIKSLEEAMKFINGILKLDFTSLVESHYKEHENEIMERAEQLGEEKIIETFKPFYEPIIEAVENMGLLVDQVLLQQVIVMNVTTFETYLKDTAISLIDNNPKIRQKFAQEITKKLDYKTVEEHELNLKMIIGQLIVQDWNFQYTQDTKKLYKRILGINNIYQNRKTEDKYKHLFEIRHIIIHNSGRVDSRFKKVTKTKKEIGELYKLRQDYVFRMLPLVDEVVNYIEKRMDRMKIERI